MPTPEFELVDLPLPPKVRGSALQDAIRALTVGGPALVVTGDRNSVTARVRTTGQRAGMKFTTRKLEDGRIGIWRVS